MVYLRWNQLQQHATSVLLWSTEQTRSGFDLVCLRTCCSGLDHPPVSTRTMLQPCPRMSCCWKAPMSLGAAVLGEQALLSSSRRSIWFLHEIGTLSNVTVNALLVWSVCSLQEGCWELSAWYGSACWAEIKQLNGRCPFLTFQNSGFICSLSPKAD